MFQKEVKMSAGTWQKEAKEVETTVVEVEGADDRTYGADSKKTR